MVSREYADAYSEVLEILKYVSQEDYNKIPKNKIQLFEKNANENYTVVYNPTKTLDEQNISKIAKGIIAILFRDYWATEIQKEKIIAKQNYERQKLENEKAKEYNPDSIFKAYKKEANDSLVKIEKEKWYKKLYLFLESFFKNN